MSGTNIEGPTFHGGPLPFITISASGECVVEEYAAKILSQIKGKIAVITVAGMYRTGKSFLMNRLIGMQEGFEVGPSVNPCTKGILIWGQPVQLADDYYAILIDTEGLGSGSNTNVDLVIFTLSVLLSSYFIYNSVGAITEDSLDQLAVASTIVRAMYGKAVHGDSLAQAEGVSAMSCPPFLWVLRDFNLRLMNEQNQAISPRDYMETCLDKSSSGEKNAIREAIKQLFDDRDCMTMIRPMESEAELRQINKVSFESLRPLFKQQIETFVEKVYTSIQPKRMGSVFLNGSSFCQLVAQYCAILNSNNGKIIPGISNLAWDNVVQTQLRTSLRDAVGLYRSVLNEEGMKKLPLSDVQIKAIHDKAKGLAKTVFPTYLLHSLAESVNTNNSVLVQSDDSEQTTGGMNMSVSNAGEMNSPSMFYREFRMRREQLMDHLKAENNKVSLGEMEKILHELVGQIIGEPSSLPLLVESWRTVVTSLENQCISRYPSQALSTFIIKHLVPAMVNITSTAIARLGGSVNNQSNFSFLDQQLREKQLLIEELQRRSVNNLSGSRDSLAVNALWDMIKKLQDKLSFNESQLAIAKADENGNNNGQGDINVEIRAIKDLLVSALTDMQSAELDKRQVEVKAENERNMIDLERRFTKQLNEARRKNELMIDDLKRNYENEIVRLKNQKTELQDLVRDLETKNGVKAAEIEKLNIVIQAGENDKNLRANLANVINQQSQLVLQFLKNGAQLNSSQASELGKLTSQASAVIRMPHIGGKYSTGA